MADFRKKELAPRIVELVLDSSFGRISVRLSQVAKNSVFVSYVSPRAELDNSLPACQWLIDGLMAGGKFDRSLPSGDWVNIATNFGSIIEAREEITRLGFALETPVPRLI